MRDSAPRLGRRSFLAGISASAGAFMLTRHMHAQPEKPAAETLPRGAFRFLVVNDLHHAAPECDPFFDLLVAQMREHREIAFCLIVGDLADKGHAESLRAIKRAFGKLGAPFYPVPGNHDNDVAGDTSLYHDIFPDRLNYHVQHRGWNFIGLDSTDGYKWNETTFPDAALTFLDQTVPKLDPKAPAVVFTHFPLAEGVRMRPRNAAEVLDRLAPLNLRAGFCGHFHGRTLRPRGAALLTTNVCCSRIRSNHDGTRPEGYLLCTAFSDGRLVQDFVEFLPATESPDMPPSLIR